MRAGRRNNDFRTGIRRCQRQGYRQAVRHLMDLIVVEEKPDPHGAIPVRNKLASGGTVTGNTKESQDDIRTSKTEIPIVNAD
jgi:hypothetical protein